MSYKLRFVQKFKKGKQKEFLFLEKKFIDLEEKIKDFPKGRRYITMTGKESTNTLIWESDFNSLEETLQAIMVLESNSLHEELFDEQIKYMTDTYTEILREFS
jgi:hypothetical protein